MTHREKVDLLRSDLRAKGVSEYTSAPLIFRCLWSLGIQVPPPFFIRFFPLAFFGGLGFAIPMSVFFWFFLRFLRMPLTYWDMLPTCAVGGLFSGLAMAAFFRWKFRKLKLPAWEDYGL